MSDMIEVIAKALRSGMQASPMVRLQANGPRGEEAMQQFFEVLAMDILEAIREPTADMTFAGSMFLPDHSPMDHDAEVCWQNMIDAALKEKSPTTP